MSSITDIKPTKHGSSGLYWHMPVPDDHPSKPLNVSCWVLHSPWCTPQFKDYTVSLIHLRRLDGFVEPELHFPEATHMVVICGLNPASKVGGDINGPFDIVKAPTIVQQFHARHDAEAFMKIEAILVDVVNGKTSVAEENAHTIAHILVAPVVGKATRQRFQI